MKSMGQNTADIDLMAWEILRSKWGITDKMLAGPTSDESNGWNGVDPEFIKQMASIDAMLTSIYGRPLSDNWMNLPNSNALFRGQTPLEFIFSGEANSVNEVAKLLYGRYVST